MKILANCNYCSKSIERYNKKRNNSYCSKECYWKRLVISPEQRIQQIKDNLSSYYDIDKNGCWIWNRTKHGSGYGSMTFLNKRKRAHRFFYELLKGPIPSKMLVCHKCDIPACINPDHLFLGTYVDNALDMVKKRRMNENSKKNQTGEKCNFVTIDENKARMIKILCRYNFTKKEIALALNTSYYTIQSIKLNKSWMHLKNENIKDFDGK